VRDDQYRAGDIWHRFTDPAHGQELLGFEAKVEFEAGMAELADWLRDQEVSSRRSRDAQSWPLAA